ncbi:hypothetical protein INR49_013192 [Caranx melampygus]|nr:hypothetical protein INR49_013192 [Caranx melampygus]
MQVLGVTAVILAVYSVHATVYFREEFQDSVNLLDVFCSDGWRSRWVNSKHKSDYGEWKLTAGDFYGDAEKDKGLQTSQDARFYATSARFEPFSNEGKSVVIQFTVKHEQKIDCGGGYVKVFPADLDQAEMHGESSYYIMFGPDICGYSTKKVHVIFNYKGKNHLIKKEIKCKDDELTHLYTLILNPDQTYEVKIDNEKVESGSLEEDWDFLPPKKIKDPEAKKPEDWDDRAKIDDADDTKPEDWDKPENIPDPDAKKPEDWDEDMDGEWEPPMIPNPEYKGEWKPKQIDNPNYKGPWVHPEIDNPEYNADSNIYKFDNIGVLGLDLWQVKSGTIFDNFLITDDVKEAEDIGNETWGVTKEPERKMKQEQDDLKRKEEEEKNKEQDTEGDDDDEDEDGNEEEEEEDDEETKDDLEEALSEMDDEEALPLSNYEQSTRSSRCPTLCLQCCDGDGALRAPETPGNMAALMTISQLSSGNPAYETYYRQLDPTNTGKVSAGDAAQFLKKSGLPDSTLGKIWDLADSERKGYLDKRGFFIALRLVASAQGGNDISLNNLNQNLAAPKFRDTNSPLLSVSTAHDSQWAIRPDEKGKFEGIFESLCPVKGLLSGDKVRPVLINSKLPLDVLGKIWDLSDVDKDGHLDKDEFTVAMHLVYRAMEKEPVPASLPASLIPPSKRKKTAGGLPGAVAVLPAISGFMGGPAPLKDTLRSTPPLGNATPLSTTTVNLSPKHSFKSSSPPVVNWVVPVADREKYNEIFKQTDTDNDGLVSGTEVIEIFMQSSLSQTMLAQIWGLADTKQTGKLTREQFSLAMYLMQQKMTKGIDPPSTLTPDMIPPSERTAASDSASSTGSAELTGIKELDDLSQEIAQLQREKFTLEQEIREKEESIRQQNSEVQDMQNDLDRESSSLQDLESQKQDAQERLEEMDQQRSKLEGMLNDVKQKCQEESQMISSLQSQIRSQESDLRSQEDELSRTKADLSRLQEEEAQLEQSLLSGRVQLDSIVKSLKTTQEEISQARSKLSLIQDNQQEMTKTIEQYNTALSDINGGNFSNLPDLSEGFAEKQNGGFRSSDDSFKSRIAMFNNSAAKEPPPDPFQTEDPFKAFKVGALSSAAPELLQSGCSTADSKDSFVTTESSKASKDCPVGFADFASFGSESQQLEWAKRESEREEQERLRRLRLQEQQDLELAIALSRADMPSA